MSCGLIDPDRLTAMWAEGAPVGQIAAAFGVSKNSVYCRARKLGLAWRGAGTGVDTGANSGRDIVPCVRPVVSAPVASDCDGLSRLEVDVMQSQGRWAALAAIAQDHGITPIKAQQIWHQVRR